MGGRKLRANENPPVEISARASIGSDGGKQRPPCPVIGRDYRREACREDTGVLIPSCAHYSSNHQSTQQLIGADNVAGCRNSAFILSSSDIIDFCNLV
ncbi:hypothetical protein RRG08_004235 [Elysia crispata]|uniref:Uncharacterized protein n=1 Tax=Elysia crispata TaxID=231223 RepID=A0AAE0ZJE4_9GAST|nr:hypothetical protein RRG08_004235 [Elysia crispata]